MISVVSPVYNEAANLEELCGRLTAVFEKFEEDFEIILVENGSQDNSLSIIKKMRQQDSRIKFVSLSRNFGHQGGILAGLAHASGEAIISMDGDLQHPPELIPEMISLWRQGYHIVFTSKIEPKEKDWRFFLTKLFYKLISRVSEIKLTYGQSDYRLLDKKVVEVILLIPEKNKFLRGLVDWVGFSRAGVKYEVAERKKGNSKFLFRHYLNFAFDGIFSFSILPLRIFLWSGLSVAFFCCLYAIIFFILGVISFFPKVNIFLPPGWATITVSITFLGGIQLIGIGFLGEYIGRIYSQTKQRPDFILKEKGIDKDD